MFLCPSSGHTPDRTVTEFNRVRDFRAENVVSYFYQNVLYLDGHVEWKSHPYCGPLWDNIWTMKQPNITQQLDPKQLDTVRAYTDTASYDGTKTLPPGSNDDSSLVP